MSPIKPKCHIGDDGDNLTLQAVKIFFQRILVGRHSNIETMNFVFHFFLQLFLRLCLRLYLWLLPRYRFNHVIFFKQLDQIKDLGCQVLINTSLLHNLINRQGLCLWKGQVIEESALRGS